MAKLQINNTDIITESSGNITYASGTLASGMTFPAGHVLQTQFNVSGAITTAFNDNHSNGIGTGGNGSGANGVDIISKAITPTAGNHIVIMMQAYIEYQSGGTNDINQRIRCYRGTTSVQDNLYYYPTYQDHEKAALHLHFVDATQTGARTYYLNLDNNKTICNVKMQILF